MSVNYHKFTNQQSQVGVNSQGYVQSQFGMSFQGCVQPCVQPCVQSFSFFKSSSMPISQGNVVNATSYMVSNMKPQLGSFFATQSGSNVFVVEHSRFQSRLECQIVKGSNDGDKAWYPDSCATHHETNEANNFSHVAEYTSTIS